MLKRTSLLYLVVIILLGSCSRKAEKQADKLNPIDTVSKDTIAVKVDTIPAVEQKKPEAETLEQVILGIKTAFTTHDNTKIAQYIDKSLGFYTIYRPGVQEIYVHATTLDFKKPIPEYYPYSKSNYKGNVVFGQLPIFDCGKGMWNKKGLFCNDKAHPAELSRTAKYMNEFQESKISDSEIQKLKQIESKSHRVILTEGDEPLIFYLTKQGEKWVLTVLDRAYGDCDA